MHHATGWRSWGPQSCQKWVGANHRIRWYGPHVRLKQLTGLSMKVVAPERCPWVAMALAGAQRGQCIETRGVQKSGAWPGRYIFAAVASANNPLGREGLAQILLLDMLVGTCLVRKASSREVAARSIKSGTTDHVSRSGNAADLKKLPYLDEFSWTALISQCTKSGQHRLAVRTYEEMRGSGIKPSSYTFVAVLKACRNLQDLASVKKIHAEVIHSGLESVLFVGNMLVDVYAKCGSLVDARRVFQKMPQRDVVSWNSMILGCAQMEEAEEAIQLYGQMKGEGVAWNDRTLVAVLKACSSLAAFEEGSNGPYGKRVKRRTSEQVRAIHSDAMQSGFESDVFVGNMLVDVYAKCGSFVDARRVFENMPKRDVVSWNAMITGCAQMEKGQVALQLYVRMQQDGAVVPDDRTFVGALKACSSIATSDAGNEGGQEQSNKRQALEHVRAIHSDILQSGSESDLFVGNMLVDVYAKCGSLVDARRVFERMPRRDVVSWTALIAGCAQMDEGEVALQLYTQMQQEGVEPNERTFVNALKACSSLADREGVNNNKHDGQQQLRIQSLERVKSIHCNIIKMRLESDVFVETMLVDAYAKCGSMVDARDVFDGMRHHDVVSWTAMIIGYADMGDGHVALQLFSRMQQESVVPNDRTFMGALKACGSLAALEKGKELHALIPVAAVGDDLSLASALMDMYGKCGSMVDAQQVFDALPTRDIVTWTTLISGYARLGESRLVFDACNRMRQDDGMHPNAMTFLSLLTVCSHAGLVDQGQELFAAMTREDCGITPTIEHYNSMVDLLGRAGRLDEAMEMVRSMPFPPNSVSWRSMLGACQKWRNVELAREAFQCAMRLNENDAAAYVLMSNICPEKGKEIQAMRLETRAWKKPGQSSWTDNTGNVHTFVAGGEQEHHDQGQAVFANLEDLISKMKEEEGVL